MADRSAAVILVVDDDEAKRYSIAKILQKAGFDTREAGTGTDGLRLVADLPDLVVLDVKLPDISGFEVCRRIKADPTTAFIPVLHLSTTFVGLEDKVYGLEGGADGYLTDVLEPLELVATINALLRARRAEEAAQISSRQWQATFDAVNDGVMLLSRDGAILQVNRMMERILGQPWNELNGMPFHSVLGVLNEPEHSPFLRMVESQKREVTELTLGGRWLHVAVDPLKNAQRALRGAICIVSDVTDRRQMEEELRKRAEELAATDRRKDEFLAMLAHELRNPLAPILNCLGLIRYHGSESEDVRQALGIAERQVKHMVRLLDDLLDVSRFTRGKIQLKKSPVDLLAVINHAVEIAAPLIERKRHQLVVDLPAEPFQLEGDSTRLEQVMNNVLNNAAKYTEPGGKITVSAEKNGDEINVRVADTGIGLSEDMVDHVFDLFVQADLTLDRSQGGLGIGLTLVKSLVELHGGTVRAHSRGLGQGSEFTVTLPAQPSSATLPRAATHPVSSRAVEALRILVVDDHADAAQSLTRILTLWGHHADAVHDGPAAIARLVADYYDVVLLDIGLPGMSGYEVAMHLRKQPAGEKLFLVALTGYGQDEDLRRAEFAGFDRHLVKPVAPEMLEGLLANLDLLRLRVQTSSSNNH
jgi:PAS domain S-box-containing protein